MQGSKGLITRLTTGAWLRRQFEMCSRPKSLSERISSERTAGKLEKSNKECRMNNKKQQVQVLLGLALMGG
jgi:hypothetical protein